MKKVILLIAYATSFTFGYSQVKTSGVTPPRKDTLKTNKTLISASKSGMPNTKLNSVEKPVNNGSLTLEELNKKVADLELQIKSISNKLPFGNMTIAEIIADDENLFEAGVQKRYKNYVLLKIDNPLCNDNPNAKIFFSPQSNTGYLKTIFYHSPYWYASFSDIVQQSLSPYDIKFYVNEPRGKFYSLIERDFTNSASFYNAIQIGSRKYLEPGDKFLFIIYQQLPNYNPSIYQRSVGQ